METKEPIVFEEIIAPVIPLIAEEADKLGDDTKKYKLSFLPFTLNLLFGIINGIKSINLLITSIQSSPLAKTLGLVNVSNSMYSEAFVRYEPSLYRRIFYALLEKLNFLEIPEIKALGKCVCTDGSVFPAIQTMIWTTYKKSAHAIKIHLSFELNRMIPVQFISTEANGSERAMLRKMLEAGVTYITDRGYICFDLFHDLWANQCHFIIRAKSNLIYEIKEVLTVDIPAAWSSFFSEVTDSRIQFKNDKHHQEYRLVSFMALGQLFLLVTDRFDLKTHEIIMLYAYRWQVELIFRFLKRTLNALHLMCHDPKGVEIQFTLYMICYLLLLSFKQKCMPSENSGSDQAEAVSSEKNNSEALFQKENSTNDPVCGLVSLLGKRLQKYWKIGIHWLTTVRNLLLEPFTPEISKIICGRQ
jgi:hypothetical protein